MVTTPHPRLSIVIPVYNEQEGIAVFHNQLSEVVQKVAHESYEIIYSDDGSSDNTATLIRDMAKSDHHIKLLCLSRNFGKEIALSAAIHMATGDAVIMLDGDGQHPVEMLPEFVEAWQAGAKVVIGVRSGRDTERLTKRFGSWLFYHLFNRITGQHLVPGSTDYRLIDRSVQQAFLRLPETDRQTRGLIDWLGFQRTYIPITRLPRTAGTASYSFRKLVKLSLNSVVSLSSVPLYVSGYLGVLITVTAFLLGFAVLIEQFLLHDPLHWKFTGTAMLSILTLFLVGIVLISQGIISLYLSYIHTQAKNRPLYIIDYDSSVGFKEPREQ
jgi:dolichol-phosphate mannosyltransferase